MYTHIQVYVHLCCLMQVWLQNCRATCMWPDLLINIGCLCYETVGWANEGAHYSCCLLNLSKVIGQVTFNQWSVSVVWYDS